MGPSPPTDAEPAHVERLLVDVTALAQREEQLRDARRLEQLGTLAALMMPDLGALIASVREAARGLASPAEDPGAAAGVLARLDLEVARAEGLVQQLSAFSRRQLRPRDRLSLGDAIARATPTLRTLTGPDVTLEIVPGAPATVVTTHDDLEQMLTSLVIAARDLLPSGGRVVVSTTRPDAIARLESGVGPAVLRAVRLRVSAEGYQLAQAALTPSLERVVARCEGVLHVGASADRQVTFGVDLPTVCPTDAL
jgi:two-component system cell cycle sensor histidine kinase/response regulator CckA